MAQVELIMPKMGESIMEATILRWVKKVGDPVKADETILEIATDKVDTEVPSPISGVVTQIMFQENDIVPVGKIIAVIATESESAVAKPTPSVAAVPLESNKVAAQAVTEQIAAAASPSVANVTNVEGRFYSPLVKNIAKAENITQSELDRIAGTGQEGRVTKKDVLDYVANRENATAVPFVMPTATPSVSAPLAEPAPSPIAVPNIQPSAAATSVSGNVEIIEMDRMRKLIADHMVMSKQTSPHVTSFVEADVTNLVNWRSQVKKDYQSRYGENLTFTPIFIEAVVKAIKDFPMINSSVDGTKIIVKKNINIGMAAALPSGNLIVPVIKNADMLNLAGITKSVNDLAGRARLNQLKPDEVQGGTFTLTNVGTFGNVMGTPIINQPQVAILAVGAIRKRPAVLETEFGDVIAIRQMMFLSLSYDHRVVDGFLGGSFLRKVADYLENFDTKRSL